MQEEVVHVHNHAVGSGIVQLLVDDVGTCLGTFEADGEYFGETGDGQECLCRIAWVDTPRSS